MDNVFKRGDLVELNGLLAVVVGVSGDQGVPEDHVALWYGGPQEKRKPESSKGGLVPEVWTVPAEYCKFAMPPIFRH